MIDKINRDMSERQQALVRGIKKKNRDELEFRDEVLRLLNEINDKLDARGIN